MSKLKLFAVHLGLGGNGVLVLALDSKEAQDVVLQTYKKDHIWSVKEIEGPFEKRSILFEFNTSGKEIEKGSAIWEFTGPNRLTLIKSGA